MTQTTARIKKAGKEFEIIVNMEKALAFRKGENVIVNEFLEIDQIFSDSKKGFKAAENDLIKAFGTADPEEIAKKIIKEGEILLTQDYRDEQQEKRVNQVVDFLAKNAIDSQSGRPHTPDRIKSALEQAHVNIKNVPMEEQINEIIGKISSIIPIRIETKKVKLLIPAIHTGRAYGIIAPYKAEENWLNNGALEVIVNVPAGMIIDFYEKLNSVTHGAIVSEELRE
jgi:ribosome maturation protein SDO1